MTGPIVSPPASRRLKLFLFTPEFLVDLFRGPPGRCVEVLKEPFPEDARIHGVAWDDVRGSFYVRIESDSYDEVLPGETIPRADGPTFRVREVGTEAGSWRDAGPML